MCNATSDVLLMEIKLSNVINCLDLIGKMPTHSPDQTHGCSCVHRCLLPSIS